MNSRIKYKNASKNLIFLLFFASILHAILNKNKINDDFDGAAVTPELSYWIPKNVNQTLQSILDNKKITWKILPGSKDSLGYLGRPAWFRAEAVNTKNHPIKRMVVISAPYLDHVNVYIVEGGKINASWKLGDSLPFSERPISHPYFLIPINIPAKGSTSIYAFVSNKGTATMPLSIWKTEAFYKYYAKERFLELVAIGFIIYSAFFALLSCILFLDLTFFYYSMFLICIAALQASLQGFLFQLFWPRNPSLNHMSLVATPAALLFILAFTERFFRVKIRHPKYMPIFTFLIFSSATIPFVLAFSFGITWSKFFVSYFGLLTLAALLLFGLILWKKRTKGAAFYSFSMISLFIGGFVAVLRADGVFPVNIYTTSSIALGSAIQALILSLGIVWRLNGERNQRFNAQKELIQSQKQQIELEKIRLHEATHHPLTMLPNRSFLIEQLENWISEDKKQSFTLCLLKLNNYAQIAPLLGWDRMKSVILSYSEWLKERLKLHFQDHLLFFNASSIEVLISIENDVFGFLISDYAHGRVNFDKLLKEVSKPFEYRDMYLAWSPVLSCIRHPIDDLTAVGLVEKAIHGFRQASQGISIFDAHHEELREQKLLLILDLKNSINEGHLSLALQPQASLNSGEIIGLEALVRWNHPKYGFIPPSVFVPFAEEIGLMEALTTWVVKKSFATLEKIRAAGFTDITLSFNVSANDLGAESALFNVLTEQIEDWKVEARQICIEITETAVMQNLQSSQDTLKRFQNLGFMVAMDDFGSGYSSLTAIQNMPLDKIKIDRGLVDGVASSNKLQNILKTAISMGKSLGLQVVAEGVENDKDLAWLKTIGCDIAQGYFICRPKGLDDFIHWLEAGACFDGENPEYKTQL